MWVPGHVGIRGIEVADQTAKKALDNKVTADLMLFFGPKTLSCQICLSSLATRMG